MNFEKLHGVQEFQKTLWKNLILTYKVYFLKNIYTTYK